MSLKNDVIWQGLRAASASGRAMSLSAARRSGRILGALAHATVRRDRRRALHNLADALPELDESARRATVRAMFRHLGQSLFEIAWLPNLSASDLESTTRFEGLEHMREATAAGRGVVLFTGHCGNWEWMAAAIGLAGIPMNVVGREIYDNRINEFIVESRRRHHVETIGRGSGNAARDILATLRKGHVLGVLIDQSIRAESADVPFFGRPAPTPIGPARLAVRAGAAAIAGFIERRDGMQIIRFEPAIETSRNDDPVALTARMTSSIEAQIRRVPDQWVWMHKRWTPR